MRNRRCRQCLGLRRVAASLGGIWTPALLNAMSSRPNPVDGRLDGSSHLVLVGDSQRTPSTAWPAISSSLVAEVRTSWSRSASMTAAPSRDGGGQALPGAGAGDEGDLAAEVVARV